MGVNRILFIVLLLHFTKCEEEDYNRKMNVGTVLFTESDNSKDCWTTESIALLTSRMMLEDVLPSKEVLIIKDTAFVTDLIDYFRLVLEVVRQTTYGKTKHIMLLALTDTLGGYLNRFVIPTAKHAYYAGYIDFDSIERLYQLFDELKCFLRSNGHGWAKPIKDFSRKMEAQSLPVQSPAPKTDPCKGLILIKHDSSSNLNSSEDVKSDTNRKGKNCAVEIPMPFFDSKTSPSAIAMPFKTYALRSMESKSASYVLVKFYMAATKCLAQMNVDKKSVDEFNSNLYSWIHSQVFPHLNDDKLYAAFGGVLRIEETLSNMGAMILNNKEMGNYNIMPDMQMKDYSKGNEDLTKRKKSNLILLALLATIFIWFILGSMFICYRIKAARIRKADQCYCGTERLEPKSSNSSKQSKTSSKMSKLFCGSSRESGSSKKPSVSSRTSKKTTTTSGRLSPAPSAGSVRTTASGHSGVSGASKQSARNGKLLPAQSGTSAGSGSSTESKSSRAYGKNPNVGRSAISGESGGSRSRSVFRKKRPKASATNKQVNKEGTERKQMKSENKTRRSYPTSCACHTTVTGKIKPSSSSEEQTKKKDKELPLVFGYQLDTSSETSQQDEHPNEDAENLEAPSK